MKKALGILAVIGSAAALVAYKLKKDEEKEFSSTNNFDDLSEDDISERILRTAEEANIQQVEPTNKKAASETTTYPNLNEEDMVYLNEISEDIFKDLEESDSDDKERPLQHAIHFDDNKDLENFKNLVINEGYVVTVGEVENDLLVLNIVEVNADVILSKVFYLANLAKTYHGRYINWLLK